MSTNPESKGLLQRIHLGKGEVWALAAALGYALYQVFLGVAMQGEVDNSVAATVQAIPLLLFATAMGWVINRRGKQTTSPFSDWRLIGALVCNGLLLFVVATPLLFESLRKGGVLITSPVLGTQVLFAAILAALLLREPFTRTMALGMVISVVGVFALTAGRSGADLSPTWWLAVPFALGTALSWALAGVLLTYTMRRGVDPFQAVAIPTIVGIVVLNGYLLVTGQIGLYGGTSGEILAILLREPLTRTIVLGMIISVVGIFVLTAGQSGADLSPTWWLAVPFALGTALCWALAGVLLTYTMRRGVDPYQAVAIPTVVGVAALNGYLLVMGRMGLYGETSAGILVSLLVAGVLSAAALISLTLALNLTTVASATTLNSLQVVIAPVIAWLFLGDDLNLAATVGILTILAGVIMVQRGRLAALPD